MNTTRAGIRAGKKKPAVVKVYDGSAEPKMATVGVLRTKTQWKKWAENAFEMPEKFVETAGGWKWQARVKNCGEYYSVVVKVGK